MSRAVWIDTDTRRNGSSFSIIKVFSPQILWAFIFAQRAIKRNSIPHKESLLNDWRASKARKPKEYHTYGELSMHGLTEIFKLLIILHALMNNSWFPTNQEAFQLPLIFQQQLKLKNTGRLWNKRSFKDAYILK